MRTHDGQQPPAEAALVRQRRDAMIPRMGMRRAAELAARLTGTSFSEATWRAIENGRYTGPADRIAALAFVVGVTVQELENCNRADAARILHEELRRHAAAEPELAGVDPDATPETVIQLLLRGLDQIRNASGLSDGQKRALEKSLMRSVQQNLTGQLDQIRTTLAIVSGRAR